MKAFQQPGRMRKVLYFFHSPRRRVFEAIVRGEEKTDGKLLGMRRLSKFGYEADVRELEDYIPKGAADWVYRYVLNVYAIHLPLFFCMFGFDIVFSATAFSNLFLKSILGIRRPRWVIFDFGIDGLIGDGRSLKRRLLRFAVARGADGIVCLSPGEAEALKKRFPDKADRIVFVPHGVDTAYFKPRPDIRPERLLFSPGRDIGRDFKSLFAATAGLDMPVLITTRPSRITKLQPLPPYVARRDLSDAEILDAYARASMVVLPISLLTHNNDASGCSTLVEAMAMGKAVIATDTKTMVGHIEDGVNGILVPPEDPAALRAAITRLLEDSVLCDRLGKAARATAEERFAADKFAESIAHLFDVLLADPA